MSKKAFLIDIESICQLAQGKINLGASVAAREFLEHSEQEKKPDMNPEMLSKRSYAKYVECKTVKAMIRENLIAERIAIDTYH